LSIVVCCAFAAPTFDPESAMPATALYTHNRREEVSEPEWRTRVDLAAAYRLVALFGWDDLVFTHISARVPGRDGEFRIYRYGFMFE